MIRPLGIPQERYGPARVVFDVVPHNTEALPYLACSLRAGGDGTITLRTIGASVDVAHPVKDGEHIDAFVTHVRATGTNVPVIGYA